jgi:hypothetical protein
MNFNFLVTFLDGTQCEADGVATDLVAFEAEYNVSVSSLARDGKITYLFWLAWHVLKRTGETKLMFAKWVDLVDTVEAQDPKA